MKAPRKSLIMIVFVLVLAGIASAKVWDGIRRPQPTPLQQLKACIQEKAKADGITFVNVILSGREVRVIYVKPDATRAELEALNNRVCRYLDECLANNPLLKTVRCRKVVGRSKPPGAGGGEVVADPPSGGGDCKCKLTN